MLRGLMQVRTSLSVYVYVFYVGQVCLCVWLCVHEFSERSVRYSTIAFVLRGLLGEFGFKFYIFTFFVHFY